MRITRGTRALPAPCGSPLHLVGVTYTCPLSPSVSSAFPLCILSSGACPGGFSLSCLRLLSRSRADRRKCTEPCLAGSRHVMSDCGRLLLLALMWGWDTTGMRQGALRWLQGSGTLWVVS